MISNNILFLQIIFFTEAKILEISYSARQEKIDHTEIIQADKNNSNLNSNLNLSSNLIKRKSISTTERKDDNNSTNSNYEKMTKSLPIRVTRVKLAELSRFVAQNSRRQLMIAWSLIEYQVRIIVIL